MELAMLIISILTLIIAIITLIITGLATAISANQLRKLNNFRENTNINIRRLYIQKIKINIRNITDNLHRFENVVGRLTDSEREREMFLKSINCLSYYITSISNKKFEEILKDLITDTEDFIKVSIDTDYSNLDNIFKLHADLKKLISIIENGNYLIKMMFKDFDEGLAEDYERIRFSSEMEIALSKHPDILNDYKELESKMINNVLYPPPGNPSILTYNTPMVYYGKQISAIKERLGLKDDMRDIPYVSINEPTEKGEFKMVMTTLDVENTLNLLKSIIEEIDLLIKNNEVNSSPRIQTF
jgi:hypothetical protein